MRPLNSNGDGPAAGASGPSSIVLTGVMTWASNCAKVRVPGVYTRISNYTTWLRNEIFAS